MRSTASIIGGPKWCLEYKQVIADDGIDVAERPDHGSRKSAAVVAPEYSGHLLHRIRIERVKTVRCIDVDMSASSNR